jgi:hypothetical protein
MQRTSRAIRRAKPSRFRHDALATELASLAHASGNVEPRRARLNHATSTQIYRMDRRWHRSYGRRHNEQFPALLQRVAYLGRI